ncbi:MAG TPA: hypothetical protein VH643_25960, partial [Gemmataceae bacterium]
MRTACWNSGILVLFIAASNNPLHGEAEKPGALEVEPEELQAGLVAHYRSLTDRRTELYRIDAKPAFYLNHSSPHPRLPAGRFEVVWKGVMHLADPPPLTFDVFVRGEVTMEVDGVTVLQGRGESEKSRVRSRDPLRRPPGLYRLKISYRSLEDGPARLQIGWEGQTFAHELLPPRRLKHAAADVPAEARQDQRAEKGRANAARLGCARCHRGAFPGVTDPPPGPSLADAARRLDRRWLLHWLSDPAKIRPDARMPVLFASDRTGFVERWIVSEYLLGPSTDEKRRAATSSGDHRLGRRAFVSLGCAACHFLPDMERSAQGDLGQRPLTNLSERLPADELAAFLGNPHARYPDGRMPRLPVSPNTARDIAAYLLLWSKPHPVDGETAKPPSAEEIAAVARRLKVSGNTAAATALLREKHCAECHPGLGSSLAADVPIKAIDKEHGCLSGRSLPRFNVGEPVRKSLAAYLAVAARERHPSPFADRQRLLDHFGCVRCHQRDSDRPSPLEAIGSRLGGGWVTQVPFQRTPRLNYPHQKFTRAHLLDAIREGVSGLRPVHYSYRMPAFGRDAETIAQALAEGDGELPAGPDAPEQKSADPTLAPLAGPRLAGFQGYACVSCHVWKGQMLSEADPGAAGTELTRVPGRIRRDWFDRYLEGPARFHPGTPMPSIFNRGQPASLSSVLNGDPQKQKDALWSYFALGKDAPSPKPPPPMPVDSPASGEPPLIAQIPIRLPGGKTVESISVLYAGHDLIVYDVGSGALDSAYTGAEILRDVQGRIRTFRIAGTPIGDGFFADPPLRMTGPDKPEAPTERTLLGYDRLSDGARLRWQLHFSRERVEMTETLRLVVDHGRRLLREFRATGIPASRALEVRSRVPHALAVDVTASIGAVKSTTTDGVLRAILSANTEGTLAAVLRYELPAPGSPPKIERSHLAETEKIDGELERPGYRAIAYPRPKTVSGEDRIMPSAVAVDPKDGRVFVASMKTGELFVLRDPTGDGRKARFDNYTRGLFQEAYSMLAEPEALYVLHRRNLTRIVEREGDGVADRFDRVALLPHGIADTYDYGYGLVRDKSGSFVYSFAPYANRRLPGSGGAVRLTPGQKPQQIAFGFRNPIGWCSGPHGDIFFTDNQGEWVATNKLCHLVEGRYYGFPNPDQPQHTKKPAGNTAVWVPYGWAKSINGVAYDRSGGKFGPFAGQFFLAELMFGGALLRADVEKVNGEYQGVCFPFWGRGLLGPLTLAFDPRGRLWVGGITEPGWMAQRDRGALFRIDFTGLVPFEMQTIRVLPRGFRIVFTAPVAPATAREAAS